MNSRPCCDVSAYDLIRMTQIWHVFLLTVLPREPDYDIASKNEVHLLDAGRGQKTIKFFGFCDYPLRQLSPHRVEVEFGQTQFHGVKPGTLTIQSYAFALPERFYITFPVLGASNGVWKTTSFGFQFHGT